jgi:NADH:ubiquinone oxidoreductase subunit 6 (subunit J)
MTLNFNLMIVILAITVIVGAITSTFYFFITTVYKPYKEGLSNKFKLSLIRLSSICTTVSTVVNNTVVELSDTELNELLQVVYNQIGDSKEISLALLHSFGLDTVSVIQYLQTLGYIIVS